MDDLDLSNKPNPFSIFTHERQRSKKKLLSAVSFLTIVVALLLLIGFGQGYWQRIRIADLMNGFSDQSTSQKIERLKELQQFQHASIAGFVEAVTDEDPQVAEFALEQLSETRQSWTTLPEPIAAARRLELSKQLQRVCSQLPENSSSKSADDCLARLNTLAQSIAQDELASTLPNQHNVETAMKVVEIAAPPSDGRQRSPQATPLPLESLSENWSDWPPAPESLPRLYRQSYPALSQVETSDEDETQPRLLRRDARAKLTITPLHEEVPPVDQFDQLVDAPTDPIRYWIAQLRSLNRRVRLRAVRELEILADQGHGDVIRQSLSAHLQLEQDRAIISRLKDALAQ